MKRLPTREEFEALLKLPYKWNEKRRGLVFTASNGNELFLTASGYRYNTDVNYVGNCGYYWSATPYDEYIAWYLYFDSDVASMGYYIRDDGYSVRLVSDKPCAGYIDMGTGIYWAIENYHEGENIYFTWNEAMAIQDKVNGTAGLLMKKDGNTPEFNISDTLNWEQRRYEIAKAALHGLLTMPIDPNYDSNIGIEELAHRSVAIADELIKQLKQQDNERD